MNRTAAINVTTNTVVDLNGAVVRVEWVGFGDAEVTLGYTYQGRRVSATLGETQLVTVVE